MNKWEVLIVESANPIEEGLERSTFARSTRWVGKADSEAEAKASAWRRWERRYGRGARPRWALVLANPLAAG
jgi:hypothetical protein